MRETPLDADSRSRATRTFSGINSYLQIYLSVSIFATCAIKITLVEDLLEPFDQQIALYNRIVNCIVLRSKCGSTHTAFFIFTASVVVVSYGGVRVDCNQLMARV